VRARSLLILTAIISSLLGAVVAWLVLTVPNDLQAGAMLRIARKDVAAGNNDKARQELSRIIQEYAEDAITALEVGPDRFNEDDHDWVMAHCAQSLPEIAKATLRLVALSASQSRNQAATLLGMAPVSLARWLDRRPRCASDPRSEGLTGGQDARASGARAVQPGRRR